MKVILVIGALLATLAATSPVVAAEPIELAPTSAWQLNYADDSCRLARNFGTGKNAVAFYLERYAPGSQFEMLVAGRPLSSLARRHKISFRFGPTQGVQEAWPMVGKLGTFDPSLIFGATLSAMRDPVADMATNSDAISVVPALSQADERAVVWLGIGGKTADEVRLLLGPMDAPMNALRTCVDELLTHWGIDAAAHKRLTRSAVPVESPGEWARPNDYPVEMLSRNQPGLVNFRLMVGADGKPTACHIQRSTRPQEFDDTVCRILMKRARFDPALGEDGKPLASYWRSSMRFEVAP